MAGGDYPTAELPLTILREARFVVCCDGGANEYIAQGHLPSIIIGDGDSLSEENRLKYVSLIHHNPDQETNDQTKGILYLINKGYKRISIVGATGKREDHTLGNISLLAEYLRIGIEVRIYTDHGVFIACQNNAAFACPSGTPVSIFSFETKGMKAKGLEYPLRDFTSWWQGTLNRSLSTSFEIECEGIYLVYLNYPSET